MRLHTMSEYSQTLIAVSPPSLPGEPPDPGVVVRTTAWAVGVTLGAKCGVAHPLPHVQTRTRTVTILIIGTSTCPRTGTELRCSFGGEVPREVRGPWWWL